MLKWIEDIETDVKQSMVEIDDPGALEQLMDLDPEVEYIELSKGHEIQAKVVDKQMVAPILQYDTQSDPTMQNLLDRLEFFKIDTTSNSRNTDQKE